MSLDRLLFAEQAGAVYTAEDLRSLQACLVRLFGRSVTPALGASKGVVASTTDLAVTAGGASGLSCTVAPGWGFIGTDGTFVSAHLVHETAGSVLTGFAAANSTLDRVDLVCVHAEDNELDAGGLNAAAYAIITGTPGGGVPADPGGQYIVLADALIPHGASHGTDVVITDRRVVLPDPFQAAAPTVNVPSAAGFEFTPGANVDLVAGILTAWPTGLSFAVPVPAWATTAILNAKLGQIYAVTSVCNHDVFVYLGGAQHVGQRLGWDPALVGNTSSQDVTLRGLVDVTSMRGTTQTMETAGERISGTGAIRADNLSACELDVIFFP